jgi:hypothetical protein
MGGVSQGYLRLSPRPSRRPVSPHHRDDRARGTQRGDREIRQGQRGSATGEGRKRQRPGTPWYAA